MSAGTRSVVYLGTRRQVCLRRFDTKDTKDRALADGRSFSIRKKYFEREELEELLAREGFGVQSAYAGDVFIGMIARRTRGSD